MTFTEAMEWTSRAFEVAASRCSSPGSARAWSKAARARFGRPQEESYVVLRRYFGRSILLGLEILVAADLIRTVAVDQTWENVLSLGLIVLIRTFLSFSLEVEMDGVWPWRRWWLGKARKRRARAGYRSSMRRAGGRKGRRLDLSISPAPGLDRRRRSPPRGGRRSAHRREDHLGDRGVVEVLAAHRVVTLWRRRGAAERPRPWRRTG